MFPNILKHMSGTHLLLITLAVMTGIGVLVNRQTFFKAALEHYLAITFFLLALAFAVVTDVVKQRHDTHRRFDQIQGHVQRLLESSEALTVSLKQEVANLATEIRHELGVAVGENLEKQLALIRGEMRHKVLAGFWDLFSEKLLQLRDGNLVVATGDGPDNLYINHMVLSLIMRETDQEFQGFTSIISEWNAASDVYYKANLERLNAGVRIERYFLVLDDVGHESYYETVATTMERQHRDGISVRYLFRSDARPRLVAHEHGRVVRYLDYPEYGLFRRRDGSEALMYRSGFDSFHFRAQLTTNRDEIRRMNIFARLQQDANDLVHVFVDRESFLDDARNRRAAERTGA